MVRNITLLYINPNDTLLSTTASYHTSSFLSIIFLLIRYITIAVIPYTAINSREKKISFNQYASGSYRSISINENGSTDTTPGRSSSRALSILSARPVTAHNANNWKLNSRIPTINITPCFCMMPRFEMIQRERVNAKTNVIYAQNPRFIL